MAEGNDQQRKVPLLAMISGAVGFVLTAGLIGFIAWEASQRTQPKMPAIEVRAGEVRRADGDFVLEFEARNTTPNTAAAVQIEGSLTVAGAEPIVSHVTLDYVPGHSMRKGGMFFIADPREGQLELRALGYVEP